MTETLRVISFEAASTDFLMKQSLLARKLFNKCYHYLEVHNCSYEHLYSIFRNDNLYRSFDKKQVAQQVMKLAHKSYKSYKNAVREYKISNNKFTGEPKPYKPNNNPLVLHYTNQCSSIKNDYIYLNKTQKFYFKPNIELKNYQQIRIKYLPNKKFKIEVIYKIEPKAPKTNYDIMAIDLGMKEVISGVLGNGSNFLISGNEFKKINDRYQHLIQQNTIQTKENKKYKISKSKRKHGYKKSKRTHDLTHKISRRVVDYAISNKISVIVIGKNDDWKRQSKLGRTNNQIFNSIPYNQIIDKIIYKAAQEGIRVIVREESYTSKCDFMANEPLCHHKIYSGKRMTRNEFQSNNGTKIHADINAALNIMRKYIDVSVPHKKFIYEEIQKKGCVYHPDRWPVEKSTRNKSKK